jgi:sulfopyruvate decarboxylase subunit beta
MAMRRDDCIGVIAAHRGSAVIVATYQAAFDLMRISPSSLNYLSIGAMGLAASHGLGLALGCPIRKIIVLDGDGSLLMNLGSLVTIAGMEPPNLVHFVCENGCYETNGSHPLPAVGISFAGMARAAGIADASEFDDLATFRSELPRLLDRTGPIFATLKVVPGDPSPQDYGSIHGAETRRRFKQALAGNP